MIAGHTGVGLSQRAQSFVTERERRTVQRDRAGQASARHAHSDARAEGRAPYLSFAVQGGDSQDQNLLQFFLNVVEFGMTPQQAVEAPNINSYQMRSSFGAHESRPGHMLVSTSLRRTASRRAGANGLHTRIRGADVGPDQRDLFDRKHGTMWARRRAIHGEDSASAW